MAELLALADAALRLAAPLLLAALGGLFSERSGIVDVGLEGKMLAGAFAAAAAAHALGSPWAGLAAAMAAGMVLALVHAFACIRHRGDQVVSGIALNVLAAGLTVVLALAWYQRGGSTPALEPHSRFLPVLLGHSLPVLAALALVPLVAFVLGHTRFGLRLRAVGESPEAVAAVGVSVGRLRLLAQILSGLFCGAAGATLALALSAGFVPHMTAGKGFMALAALVFGKWRPVPTLAACLLFGLLEAGAVRLEGVGSLPLQLVQALPYILTVVVLAGFVGRAVPPRALGRR